MCGFIRWSYFPDYTRRSHAARNPSSAVLRVACLVTLDFEGMWAGGAAAGGAGGSKKTQKRRRRREAKEQREAMQQAQLAGELDGRSRGGRERRAAAAGEDEQPATSSSIA